MAMIKVKPAKEGLKVRNPKNMKFIPAEGLLVEESSYWARRLQDGDVVLVQEQPAAAPAPAAKVSKPKHGGA